MTTLGYGKKPWGFGGYGTPLTLPQPAAPSELSSSRLIEDRTGRYVTNDEGGFEPMDDTAQRVWLLVAFAARTGPFITARDMAAQEAVIRAALKPLTTGTEPAIRLLAVTVTQVGPTSTAASVRYVNRLTGTEQTVEPSL